MSVESATITLTAEQKQLWYADLDIAWEGLKSSHTSIEGALRGSIRNLSNATKAFAASFADGRVISVVDAAYEQSGYYYESALPLIADCFEGIEDKVAHLYLTAFKLVDAESFFTLILATQVFEAALIDVEASIA